jgi:hypothetical protein
MGLDAVPRNKFLGLEIGYFAYPGLQVRGG